MDDRLNRRRMLKLSGVAGTAALAGCSGIPGLGGGGGGGNYKQWMYAPGEFGDNDHYRASVLDATTVEENEDALSSSADDFFSQLAESYNSQHGLRRNEVSTVINLGVGQVLTGDFGADTVTGDLEDSDYDEDTTHEGYAVYTKDDASNAFGVKDGTVVVGTTGGYYASTDDDPNEIVEGIIDTKKGNVERYQSASDDMSELQSKVNTGTYFSMSTQDEVKDGNPDYGQFEGEVGSGGNWTINGDTTSAQLVVLYVDQDSVNVDDVEDWAKDSYSDYDNIKVNQNGRAVVVEGEVSTDDLFGN